MADADGEKLDRRAVLDIGDHFAKMLFKIAAAVHRQGRIIDRRAIRDHQHDPPILGAGQQALMRPHQCLAVDILFQDALAQHQSQRLARAAPRRVGTFIHDMAKIIQAPGRRRLAGLLPQLA